MNKPLFSSLTVAMITIGAASTVRAVGESAKGTPLPLIEIAQRLERDGYGPFSELSMDDGNWEVEVRKQRESLELTVDAVSGKVLSIHRDDSEPTPSAVAMPLSKLLRAVSDNGSYERIDEVSFERRYWEIEVYKNGQKRELHVDPITAKVIADRIDD